MSYSQEEIEKKRLLALERKKQIQIKNNSFTPTTIKSIPSSNSSPTVSKNKDISTNVTKSFSHGASKYINFKAKLMNKSVEKNTTFGKQKERYNPISTQNFFGQTACITARCYMISDERFKLDTSSYPHLFIDTLKQVPSRSYGNVKKSIYMKTKSWNFLLKDYENVMEKIALFKSDIQSVGLPNIILQLFRKNDTLEDVIKNVDLSDIDPQLLKSLMPFQRDGICYGIAKQGRCMIADDMGLGKTIQALGIAYYFRNRWPLLIVAPSSVRYQWAEAIYKFLPSVPAQYIQQYTNTKDFIDNSKIVITTYDLLVRSIDIFKVKHYGFVILDESHTLKSNKTARFKAAQSVTSKARHVVLLSGTPALSRPMELYSQINLIMPNFMGYQEYGIRYCAGQKTAFRWDFSGSSNMQELQLLLKKTCVIRRLKNEVLNELPAKMRKIVILDPSLIKAGTKEMEEMSRKLERKVLSGVERHNALLQYYNESSIAKQKAICDYVSKLFKEKQKCIIFAHHQNVLDAICEVAESSDIKYIRIDGKTNPERRKYQVDKFQSCDSYTAAILSITAANAGITLTAAKLVVFAELFWNPGVLSQAEDRVHRIGQDYNVTIQYLIAKQTADDYLWPLIQKKKNVLNEVGLDHDFTLENIDNAKQALNSKQKTLDSFTNNEQCKHVTDKKEVKTKENVENNGNESKNVSESQFCTTEELQKLLELNEEDFNFCDWDDME